MWNQDKINSVTSEVEERLLLQDSIEGIAKESEALVDDILKQLINNDEGISSARVNEYLQKKETPGTQTDVKIESPNLTEFDELLNIEETA